MTPDSSTETPSIALVVLNWNGVTDTLECLASLRQSIVPIHAIVVDNHSTGPDAALIRASGLADIVIETGANLGFAGGNDVGLRYALSSPLGFEIIGVLNNDTLADADCFGGLARRLVEAGNHEIAICPTIVYADRPTEVWFRGGVIDHGWPRHRQRSELDASQAPTSPSEWLTGCCIVARAATWRRVGLFDPRYFVIFEDCDWSLRARHADVALCVSSDSTIRHKVSRSFASPPSSLLASFYFLRNGVFFQYGHARRYLPRFVAQQLIRPTTSAVLRLSWTSDLTFRWLGALSVVLGRFGRAPLVVERLASRKRSVHKSG